MTEENLESKANNMEWRKIGIAEVADRYLSHCLPGITSIGSPRVIPTSYELRERMRR